MPGDRNLIGRAYVEILTEGNKLDSDTARALNKAAKDQEKAEKAKRAQAKEDGQKLGDTYAQSQRKAMRKALKKNDFNEFAALQTSNFLRMGENAGKLFGKSFRERMERELGDPTAAKIFTERMYQAAADGQLRKGNLAATMRRQLLATEKDMQKLLNDEKQRGVDIETNMSRVADDYYRRQSRAAETLLTEQRKVRESTDKLHEKALRLNDVFDRKNSYASYASNIAAARSRTDRFADRLGNLSKKLDGVQKGADRMRVTNLFSRSRWLRPIGAVIGLLTSIPSYFVKAGKSALDAGQKIASAFATEGASGGFKAIFGVVASASASIIGFGAVLLGLFALIGPLIVLISALVAVLVALTSVLVIGAIGAVGAFLPLIAAAAPLVAVLALGFTGNNDAIKEGIKPLRDWAEGLRGIVKGKLLANFSELMDGLVPILERTTPLLENSADAIRRGFGKIVSDLQKPDFLDRYAELSDPQKGLPKITESLLSALGLFTTGIVGFIVDLLPYGVRLADNINSIADRFSTFTNSADGKNKIQKFFDDAWKSAVELGKFVRSAWGVLAETFLAGNEPGQGFLKSITDSLDRFKEFVKTGGLEKWFQDAKDVMKDLGPTIDGIASGIASFTTPEAKQRLSDILETVGQLAGDIGVAVRIMEFLIRAFIVFLKINPVTGPIYWLMKFVQWISTVDWPGIGKAIIDGIWSGLQYAWDAFIGFFAGLWDNLIATAKGILGIHSPSTVFAQMGRDLIQGLINGLGELLGSLLQFFIDLPAKIISALGNLASQLFEAVVGGAKLAVEGAKIIFNGLVDFIGGLPQLAYDALKNLASKIAQPFEDAYNRAKGWVDKIKNLVTGQISLPEGFGAPAGSGGLGTGVDGNMRGGFVNQPGMYAGKKIGERGLTEVVVPMELPISQVDPSVRWMAELIRGDQRGREGNMRGGMVSSGGVTIEAGAVQVTTASTDPWAVGQEVLNHIVARIN